MSLKKTKILVSHSYFPWFSLLLILFWLWDGSVWSLNGPNSNPLICIFEVDYYDRNQNIKESVNALLMPITFIMNIFSPGQMTSVCIVVWSDGHQGQSKTDFMWVVELFSSLDICVCIPSSSVLLSATTWCTSWWPTASRWWSWQSATSRYLHVPHKYLRITNIYKYLHITHNYTY